MCFIPTPQLQQHTDCHRDIAMWHNENKPKDLSPSVHVFVSDPHVKREESEIPISQRGVEPRIGSELLADSEDAAIKGRISGHRQHADKNARNRYISQFRTVSYVSGGEPFLERCGDRVVKLHS